MGFCGCCTESEREPPAPSGVPVSFQRLDVPSVFLVQPDIVA
eukprot:COSAG01_NODE_5670_length_4108_cov_15.236219_7_plen_41_part_01